MSKRQKRDEIWFEQNVAWRLRDESDRQQKLDDANQDFKTISCRVRQQIERKQFSRAVPKHSLISVSNRLPIGLVGVAAILLLAILIRLPHSGHNPDPSESLTKVHQDDQPDFLDGMELPEVGAISENEAKQALAIANAGLRPVLRTRPDEAIRQFFQRIALTEPYDKKRLEKRSAQPKALDIADGDQIVAQLTSQILGLSD